MQPVVRQPAESRLAALRQAGLQAPSRPEESLPAALCRSYHQIIHLPLSQLADLLRVELPPVESRRAELQQGSLLAAPLQEV
jgi:hypothetical protein